MTVNASITRRVLFLLLAAAFVGAAQVDAYGLQRCPHHDALPGPQEEAPETPSPLHEGAAGHGAAAAGAGHDHPDEPCTCLGECTVCPVTPLPVPGGKAAADLPPAGDAFAGPAFRDTGDRGPRHALFELHLPNAPPLLV